MIKEEKLPLISIVLPVYNIEGLIEKCFDSLRRQTYSNLEIIFIDDGSTDNSQSLCEEFAKERKDTFVYHKENGGLSDARNFGIKCAHGEFISFIDPDDYFDDDLIEYLYVLTKKYNTNMSICQHKVFYQSGKVIDYGKKGDEVLEQSECLERMLYYDVIDTSAWAKLYKHNLFKDIQYPKDKLFEDLATTYKLMMKCENIACGYESKYNYIMREKSISNSGFSTKKLEYVDITDSVTEEIIKVYPELYKAALARRVRARFSTINLMINANELNYLKEKKQLRNYILRNGKESLLNPKVSKDVKCAIILIAFSYRLYAILWKLYRKGAV